MKKLVSLIMVIILALGAPLLVFGQEGYNEAPLDLVQNKTEILNINGEVVLTNTISKSSDNTSIEIISQNNTLTAIEENEISVNGSSIAKIEEVISDIKDEPAPEGIALSTIYSETPIFGTTSDYLYYGTSNGTLWLSNILMALSTYALTEAIVFIVSLYSSATRLAGFTLAMLPLAFQSSSALYYTTHLYKHKTLPSFYWQNTYDWYFDAARTIYIESESVYAARV